MMAANIFRRYTSTASRRFILPAARPFSALPQAPNPYDLTATKRRDDVLVRNNPFRWPSYSMNYKTDCYSIYLRIDMPGVTKKNLTVWITKDTVFFKGIAEKEYEYEEAGERVFAGNLLLMPSAAEYDTKNISAELKDGVCRLVVPFNKELLKLTTNDQSPA